MIEITDDIREYVDDAVMRLMDNGFSRLKALEYMRDKEQPELTDNLSKQDKRVSKARLAYIRDLIDELEYELHCTIKELIDLEVFDHIDHAQFNQ